MQPGIVHVNGWASLTLGSGRAHFPVGRSLTLLREQRWWFLSHLLTHSLFFLMPYFWILPGEQDVIYWILSKILSQHYSQLHVIPEEMRKLSWKHPEHRGNLNLFISEAETHPFHTGMAYLLLKYIQIFLNSLLMSYCLDSPMFTPALRSRNSEGNTRPSKAF